MPIFLPLFFGLFILAPLLVAWVAWDLLKLRSLPLRIALFLVIAWLNWQWWQAPKTAVVQSAAWHSGP
jgi:hypothetical protein